MSNLDKEFNNYFLVPQRFENAVRSLLKKPSLTYMRELRENLDRDPSYLENHKSEVVPQLDHWLSNAGIFWDGKILEGNWQKLVRDVVTRLRSIEKSKR